MTPKLNIVASMTTIPSRIQHIRPVIDAALSQSAPVAHLEINIPYVCFRMKRDYEIPAWLKDMDRVRVFRTHDFGPITKIAPTLIRYRNDPSTHIWSIDDDCALPPDQLALLLRAFDEQEPRILTRYGGDINAGDIRNFFGSNYASFFEGFGSVLYPPRSVQDDFAEYVDITSKNDDCRRSDDIVLSMYFNKHKIPIYLYNTPTDATPYMVEGALPHADNDALSAEGHIEKYRRVFRYISSLP